MMRPSEVHTQDAHSLTEKRENYLNPLEAPPQFLKGLFRSWRPHSSPIGRQPCVDIDSVATTSVYRIPLHRLQSVLDAFFRPSIPHLKAPIGEHCGKIYCIPEIPGLMVAPSLLPPATQVELLSRLLHRDLVNPLHQTNLHLHHDIIYPKSGASFFSEDPSSINFVSHDGNEKKNLAVKKALEKKLRWMTLGGQYNWTDKEYPLEEPPEFPTDIAQLIQGVFTDMEPQAAIVNLYSPGDTLSMHRDVSEEVDRGLVSISIGCEAIFIVGVYNEKSGETKSAVLRLQSGDAVYMTGESRFAWHGVPWIIADTCPKYLDDWPGNDHQQWKGWMKNKRVNLNVRQMRRESSTLHGLSFESVS